jgi:DNA polymerase-4
MSRRILHADFNSFTHRSPAFSIPRSGRIPLPSPKSQARHAYTRQKRAAKKFGVRTGEPIWQAKQKAPARNGQADFAVYQNFPRSAAQSTANFRPCEAFGWTKTGSTSRLGP